jgi:hypothetical protein
VKATTASQHEGAEADLDQWCRFSKAIRKVGEDSMCDQSQLPQFLAAIAQLAARDDLAAVILHLNDTYQIEARPPDTPGMARIASLVQRVTTR